MSVNPVTVHDMAQAKQASLQWTSALTTQLLTYNLKYSPITLDISYWLFNVLRISFSINSFDSTLWSAAHKHDLL